MRALKWLVDEKRGVATAGQLSEFLAGTRKGWTGMTVVRFLARQGWVEVREPENARFNDSEIFVTDSGRLWRDYFDWETERLKMTRIQTHARIRALELVLKPLIRMHEQYEALGCATSSVATQLECRLANLVLNMPNSDSIVYPWSPGYVGDTCNGPSSLKGDFSRPDQNDSSVGTGSGHPD